MDALMSPNMYVSSIRIYIRGSRDVVWGVLPIHRYFRGLSLGICNIVVSHCVSTVLASILHLAGSEIDMKSRFLWSLWVERASGIDWEACKHGTEFYSQNVFDWAFLIHAWLDAQPEAVFTVRPVPAGSRQVLIGKHANTVPNSTHKMFLIGLFDSCLTWLSLQQFLRYTARCP